MKSVLRAIIEADVPYMYLFFTLREVYNDASRFQDGYSDFIMDYARYDRKLLELKNAIDLVMSEMIHVLCTVALTRGVRSATLKQVKGVYRTK